MLKVTYGAGDALHDAVKYRLTKLLAPELLDEPPET
jgi:hypothetical protein